MTFYRLADHEWGHVLIERDDRVVYRMHAGPITGKLPHDLVHFTVEETLDVADGIWGAIAGGVVFRSMTHVAGRRPPHAAERSTELKRTYRNRIQRAELLGGIVETAADDPDTDLRDLLRRTFPDETPDPDAVAGAAAALHRAGQRWQALPVGAELTLHWPPHRRIDPRPGRGSKTRGRRPREARAGRTGRST